jgi:hypothetical protein
VFHARFIPDRKLLQAHLKKCTGSDIKCPTCYDEFKDRFAKARHIKWHISPDRTPDYDYRCFSDQQGGGDGRQRQHRYYQQQQRHHQLYSSPKDEIVSFMDTDLDAVVALILKDPAIPIGATKRNTSPRTLQQLISAISTRIAMSSVSKKRYQYEGHPMAKRCKCAKLRASTVSLQ